MPCSATYLLEVGWCVSLKVGSKVCPRGKRNSEILDFKVVFLKQKSRSATKQFEMFLINLASAIPGSATYFPEVGARVSLKVATKWSPSGKKDWNIRFLDCFSKGKMEECNQHFEIFWINLKSLCLFQLHIF